MAVTQTDLDDSTLMRVDELSANDMKQALIKADGIGYFDTLADFKASTKIHKEVHISGYYTDDDSAFGSLKHYLLPDDGTVYTEQGGIQFQTASGRWYKLAHKGFVEPEWFGAKGLGSGNAWDDTASFQLMLSVINKDDDFPDAIAMNNGAEKGVGGIKGIWANPDAVYTVSDTLIFSTNTHFFGNGCTFVAIAGCENKPMLQIKYNFDGGSVQAYGTMLNAMTDFNINGKQKASIGLLLDRVNWSSFANINISGCIRDTSGHYGQGLKLEEVQYSTFINIHAGKNDVGFHLGSSPENSDYRCADLTFVGCSANNSNFVGMHISNCNKSIFNKLDIGRCGKNSILFDNDNGDGTVISTDISRDNIFNDFSAEYKLDDGLETVEPIIKIDGNAYMNVFNDATFQIQGNTFIIACEMTANAKTGTTFNNPRFSYDNNTLLPRHPSDATRPYPMFKSGKYGGLIVNFKTWNPAIEDVNKIAADENGDLFNDYTDLRVSITVDCNFYKFSNVSQNRQVVDNKDTDGFITIYKDNQEPSVQVGNDIRIGDGVVSLTTAPTLKSYSSGTGVQITKKVKIGDNAWDSDNTFWIGSYQLWVDTVGSLRIKKFGAGSDTDGVVVGSQS